MMSRLLPLLIAWSMLAVTTHVIHAASEAQVNTAIQRGNAFLLGRLKDASGGTRSLAAYALLKTGAKKDAPEIQAAIAAAVAASELVQENEPDVGQVNILGQREYVYSVSCHVFLLEAADEDLYREPLGVLNAFLEKNQQANGSWFYTNPPPNDVGDTSQLQFALLALWSGERANNEVTPEIWQAAVQWLLRTQMSDGGFCYQPKGMHESERETSLSCTLGGASALLIARRIFYPGVPFGDDVAELAKPKEKRFGVLDRMRDNSGRRQSRPFTIPVTALDKSISRAVRVIDERFRLDGDQGLFKMYMFYSMERTAALLDSDRLGRHDWFEAVSNELIKLQLADGSWSDRTGALPATSFALLSLNRTTSKVLGKSPGKKVGGGLLAGARGLPGDLSKLQLKDGQAQDRKSKGEVDDLLSELEKVQDVSVEEVQQALLESIDVEHPETILGDLDRLRRLAVDPRADVRRTAYWAIGRSGEIRLAPLLIAGLQDVDVDVIREASYGLTVLSRKPTGIQLSAGKTLPVEPLEGVDEDATEEMRQEKLNQWLALSVPAWKKWYHSVRPYEEREDRQELRKK